jgi:hypothetical protein
MGQRVDENLRQKLTMHKIFPRWPAGNELGQSGRRKTAARAHVKLGLPGLGARVL